MSHTLRDPAITVREGNFVHEREGNFVHEKSQSSRDTSGGQLIKAKMEEIVEDVSKTKCPIVPHPTWALPEGVDTDILYGLYDLKFHNKWDFSLEAYNLNADFSECPFEKVLPKDALQLRSMMPPIKEVGLRTEWIDVGNETGRKMVEAAMQMQHGLMLTQMRIFKEIKWTAELDGELGNIMWDTSGVQGQFANYTTKPVSILVHKSGPGYLHRSDNGFLCEVFEGKSRSFTEEREVKAKQAKDGVADAVITETKTNCRLPSYRLIVVVLLQLVLVLLIVSLKPKLPSILLLILLDILLVLLIYRLLPIRLPICRLPICRLPICRIPICRKFCSSCCACYVYEKVQVIVPGQAAEDGYVKTTIARVFTVDPVPGWRLTIVSQSPLHVHPPARQAEKHKDDTQQSPWFYIFDLSPHNFSEDVFKIIASLRAVCSREPLLIGGVPETVTYTDATMVLENMLPEQEKASMLGGTNFKAKFGGFTKKADEEPEKEGGAVPGEVEKQGDKDKHKDKDRDRVQAWDANVKGPQTGTQPSVVDKVPLADQYHVVPV